MKANMEKVYCPPHSPSFVHEQILQVSSTIQKSLLPHLVKIHLQNGPIQRIHCFNGSTTIFISKN